MLGYLAKGKRKAPRGCRLAVYLPTDTLLRGSGKEHRGINRLRMYQIRIASLNLTENMRIALECRQNGLSYPEIGRVLSRAQATVYEYFIKMRQRYMAIYG